MHNYESGLRSSTPRLRRCYQETFTPLHNTVLQIYGKRLNCSQKVSLTADA